MSKRRRKVEMTPFTATITGLSHEGRGIARVDEKIVFIFGALPGETVRAKRTRSFSRFDEATTLEVLTPSVDRVAPPCPHFGVCGGCQLQHLTPSKQIDLKQGFLEEQLRAGNVVPQQWMPPLLGDSTGYRYKARLGVKYVHKKESLLVGFREQKDSKIAVLESCSVLHPRVGESIQDLRTVIESLEAKEHIPQIEVAAGTEQVALVFRHLVELSEGDIAKLSAFCKSKRFLLYLQPKGPDSVHQISEDTSMPFLNYDLGCHDVLMQFHPLDFTQVNPSMNQKMVDQALAWLGVTKEDTVLDLFCGLGNFSLPLARQAKHVVGVEGAKEMVERATMNAKANAIDNVEFYASDLNTPFDDKPFAKKAYNKVLIDPPRSGAAEVVNHISKLGASILYISCNPATFARDAAILVNQHGLQLKQVGLMDMFPHTAHVETMGLFE